MCYHTFVGKLAKCRWGCTYASSTLIRGQHPSSAACVVGGAGANRTPLGDAALLIVIVLVQIRHLHIHRTDNMVPRNGKNTQMRLLTAIIRADSARILTNRLVPYSDLLFHDRRADLLMCLNPVESWLNFLFIVSLYVSALANVTKSTELIVRVPIRVLHTMSLRLRVRVLHYYTTILLYYTTILLYYEYYNTLV